MNLEKFKSLWSEREDAARHAAALQQQIDALTAKRQPHVDRMLRIDGLIEMLPDPDASRITENTLMINVFAPAKVPAPMKSAAVVGAIMAAPVVTVAPRRVQEGSTRQVVLRTLRHTGPCTTVALLGEIGGRTLSTNDMSKTLTCLLKAGEVAAEKLWKGQTYVNVWTAKA